MSWLQQVSFGKDLNIYHTSYRLTYTITTYLHSLQYAGTNMPGKSLAGTCSCLQLCFYSAALLRNFRIRSETLHFNWQYTRLVALNCNSRYFRLVTRLIGLQLASCVRVIPAAVDRIFEEEQGLFCATEEVCISPPLGSDEIMSSSNYPPSWCA